MQSLLGRTARWLYRQPYILLSFTFFTWAANIVVGRFVVGHIPPIALTFIRWSAAFAIVLPFAWPYLRRDWPAIRANMVLMTVLAVTGISAYHAIAYWSLHDTSAINALMISSTTPLVVALWAFAIFRDRMTTMQMAGIMLSLVGVVIVLCQGDIEVLRGMAFKWGDLWACAAVVVFAFYSVLVKSRPAIHPLSFLAFTMGWGSLWLIPFYTWEIQSGSLMALDTTTLLALFYVVAFPSIAAYFCFNRGVELVGPNQAAALYPLIVVFGSILAIVFLGERPQLFHVIGSVLVLCGVIFATRQRRGRITT